MKDSDYKKEFLNVFARFEYKYSKWEVWQDFLYLAAASMANAFPTKERAEREKTYLSIIKKYPKELQDSFTELLAIVALALDENPEQDFLGELYHRLNLQQHQKGQFFTPYHICEFMSEIQMVEQEAEDNSWEKGYITVGDCACGAGAMLIAFANVARKHKINFQTEVLFFAQDIDLTAVLMCYVQLSLLGCSAFVIVGDSLAKPGFHPDNQVWCTPMYYVNWWRFRKPSGSGGNEETAAEGGHEASILPVTEGASGQLAFDFDAGLEKMKKVS